MTAKRTKQHISPNVRRNIITQVAQANSQRERILVVNDEKRLCETISSMLKDAGYECESASDGLEALAVLEAGEEFDLLLTDTKMPNLDGIGLLERAKDKFPDMPVVIESAPRDFLMVVNALRNGAYDYLLNPFERQPLLALVHRALEYRRLKLDNRAYQNKLGTLEIPTNHKPERIVVQDDVEDMRDLICFMLTSQHYECRPVASPAEVLDVLNSGQEVDLVLCGLIESLDDKLLERVTVQFPDIPIVVASAYSNASLFLSALSKGAYDYLQKPFDLQLLGAVVHRALEYRCLKLENRAYREKLAKIPK